MTQSAATNSKAFSIRNFREVLRKSSATKYLSDMEIQQVRTAIEEKDLMLLGRLYEILLQQQASDEKIVRDFIFAKNRLTENFETSAVKIEKRDYEAKYQQRQAAIESEEKQKAENIINDIQP
jgi:hypothetical protein